jgi:hypothetical protein
MVAQLNGYNIHWRKRGSGCYMYDDGLATKISIESKINMKAK